MADDNVTNKYRVKPSGSPEVLVSAEKIDVSGTMLTFFSGDEEVARFCSFDYFILDEL